MQPEQTLDIDRLAAEAGSLVEFREVLLIAGDGGDVQVGAPFVDGARVIAEVMDQGRAKKLFVFKYKNKTRYRRRRGHRQAFTRLAIKQILTDGQAAPAVGEEKKPATRRRAAPKAPETAKPAAAPAEEAPTAEATAAPTRSRAPRARKPKAGAGTEATAPEGKAGPKAPRRRRPKATAENEEVKEDGS